MDCVCSNTLPHPQWMVCCAMFGTAFLTYVVGRIRTDDPIFQGNHLSRVVKVTCPLATTQNRGWDLNPRTPHLQCGTLAGLCHPDHAVDRTRTCKALPRHACFRDRWGHRSPCQRHASHSTPVYDLTLSLTAPRIRYQLRRRWLSYLRSHSASTRYCQAHHVGGSTDTRSAPDPHALQGRYRRPI